MKTSPAAMDYPGGTESAGWGSRDGMSGLRPSRIRSSRTPFGTAGRTRLETPFVRRRSYPAGSFPWEAVNWGGTSPGTDVDMKILKTDSSFRLVPVHPALLELGLLERAKKLAKFGHERLLPDCQPKVLNGTDLKWAHALAKDWQARKTRVTARANVSAYSGRHSMADLLRELDVSAHDCEKFLGHSYPGINGNYGRKGLMPDKVIDAFIKMDAPIGRWLRPQRVRARLQRTGRLARHARLLPRGD